jgi:hypothetical protein
MAAGQAEVAAEDGEEAVGGLRFYLVLAAVDAQNVPRHIADLIIGVRAS